MTTLAKEKNGPRPSISYTSTPVQPPWGVPGPFGYGRDTSMIETIVIRNIKRDHSDKPTVVLSETKFEKKGSYQCNENKPGIWLMNWAMGSIH